MLYAKFIMEQKCGPGISGFWPKFTFLLEQQIKFDPIYCEKIMKNDRKEQRYYVRNFCILVWCLLVLVISVFGKKFACVHGLFV